MPREDSIRLQGIRFFTDSPDAGDPACVCSYCGERIEEQEDPCEDDPPNDYEGEPIRMWNQENLEARFHLRCFNEVLERGLLVWP